MARTRRLLASALAALNIAAAPAVTPDPNKVPLPTPARPVLMEWPYKGGKAFALMFTEPRECREDQAARRVLYEVDGTDSDASVIFCSEIPVLVQGRGFDELYAKVQQGRVGFSSNGLNIGKITPLSHMSAPAARYQFSSYNEHDAFAKRLGARINGTTLAVAPTVPRRTPAAIKRPIPIGARSQAAGAPTATDILNVHGRTYAKYYRGSITGTPGEVAYPSPFGGIAYYERRRLTNLSCTRDASGMYRCSYAVSKTFVAAPDSVFGQMQTSFMRPSAPTAFSYSFGRLGGVWQSPDLDNEVLADVQKAAAQRREQDFADSKRKAQDDERQRKFNECTREVRLIPCSY